MEQQRIPPTLKVIGIRPDNVPADWAIHKAIRPLCGDMLWKEDGFFFAAVAPHCTSTAYLNGQNWQSKAITQEYISLETAIAEQTDWYREHAPKLLEHIDLNDVQVCAQMVVTWRNRQRIEYERAVAEST